MSATAGATGVLGGTFDPIHEGHLAVATQCLELLGLAQVRLVPSCIPPHREPPAASPDDRLAMTGLAVAGRPGLVADDIEVRRGGVSYTVETLEQLRAGGLDRLVLLIGRDAAQEMGGWHRAAEVAGLAEVVVFNRSGDEFAGRGGELPAATRVVEVESPEISATRVREGLANGIDMSGLVPAPVLEYIREHGLYAAAHGGSPEPAVMSRPG